LEIHHEQPRNLLDLETWRKQLCSAKAGPAIASGRDQGVVTPADRTAIIKRLDDLYIQAGRAAMRVPVPQQLEKSKVAALAADQEHNRSEAVLQRTEEARQEAVGQQEAARLTAEAVQARMAHQRAETNSKFAHLVFGRDCISAGIIPPEIQPCLDEIRRLQQLLAGQA
jgi:hypothetical protein